MPDELSGGHWVQPTIWTGLADEASVWNEEIFGPCCHIRPFGSEEEAIAVANATDYGLSAAIFTQDLSRAHRVAAERSEEHTSELPSLMRISYAVFFLNKKKT